MTARHRDYSDPGIILLMGVSGCGKSVVGHLLATRLGVAYLDADDLHPASNVLKMKAGLPLTETDRSPWLEAVAREIAAALDGDTGLVVACSALKKAYRDRLRRADPGLRIVWLSGPSPLIRSRLDSRTGHFMPPSLLESQLEILESPLPDERAVIADIRRTPAEIAAWLEDQFKTPSPD